MTEATAARAPDAPLGVVAIGRNEGERLRRCLASLAGHAGPVVYVDSDSSDDSVECARAAGCHVVALDASPPLTAARARNAGFEALLARAPTAHYVQFVDGDCELAPGWLEAAQRALRAEPEVAAVSGRLRERHRDASIYNRLCDMEWDGPAGEIDACGGNAMLRVEAFRSVGGFDPAVIAAEDDELCVRLRLAGLKIVRIDADMGWHDAAMTRFGQWWTRATRTGYAFAQGAAMHGHTPLRHFRHEVASALVWGAAVPVLIACAGALSGGWALLLLAVYPVQVLRVYRVQRQQQRSRLDAAAYATNCIVAKFAHVLGVARFWLDRAFARPAGIIEYK